MSKAKKQKPNDNTLTKVSTAGFTFIFAVLFFWYIGKQVDQWLETQLIFQLLGIFLGLTGGFIKLFQMVKEINESEKN